MKYISLFSGIGGFEIAIHSIFPDAECIAYSEVDKFALKVYSHHFPTHYNLGDITTITEETIQNLLQENGGCDLLVGGFPCQNLSSLSHLGGNSQGLDGPKSGLFFPMLNMIEWILKYNTRKLSIIIENNASMKNSNKEMITNYLKKYISNMECTMLNGADFGVQRRKRIYWTNFKLDIQGIQSLPRIQSLQTWKNILEPIEKCKNFATQKRIEYFNQTIKKSKNPALRVFDIGENKWNFKLEQSGITRWQKGFHSDTQNEKSSTYVKDNHLLIDRRTTTENSFYIRFFEPVEIERLFFIPDGWVSCLCSKTRCFRLLGNTVVVKVIEFIIKNVVLE